MLIRDWIRAWEKEVPLFLQEEWDNSGMQFGRFEGSLNSIVFCLDLNEEAVDLAIEKKAGLIFTHHPIIFPYIKSISPDDYRGRLIIKCLENSISVYSSHTPFDFVDGGLNHYLADLLGMKNCRPLSIRQGDDSKVKYSAGLGRIGEIEETTLSAYGKKLGEKFKNPLIVYGNPDKVLKRAACLGGSGASFIDRAIEQGADVFISSDMKYHEIQAALRSGLCLIDLGHNTSEDPAMDLAIKMSREIDPGIECFRVYTDEVKRRIF